MKYTFLLSSFLLLSASSVQAVMPEPPRAILPRPIPPRPTPPRILVADKPEQPVELRSVQIRAEIAGGFAVTETEFEFYNPNNRLLEGSLEFPLLEGQKVSGFALDFDGKWRGAVPIDKPKAQQVFEDISRRKVDPAVLEQTQGNNYRVRVYPLPPRGIRKVRVQVSEKLGLDGVNSLYRLPLAFAQLPKFKLNLRVENPKATVKGFDELGKITLEAQDFDTRVLNFDKSNYSGAGTLEVRIPLTEKVESFGQNYAGQRYFMTVLPKPEGVVPRRAVKKVDLLWDSSLSAQNRNLERELAVLEAYFKKFPNVNVRLIRFRDTLEPIQSYGVNAGNWSILRAELEKTVYDGATNFDALNCAALKGCAGISERLLFSDGLDNASLRQISASSVPLYVLSSSVKSDPAKLKYLTLNSGGAYLDLTRLTAAQAARELLSGGVTLAKLRSSDARRLSVQEDAQNWYISGIRNGESDSVALEYEISGKAGQTKISNFRASTLIARQWATNTLELLAGEADLNAGEIKRLGQAFGLVTPQTSLIVLDSVQDYVRYEINPPDELEAEYKRLRQEESVQVAAKKRTHDQYVLKLSENYLDWWKKDFPKGKAPALEPQKETDANGIAVGQVARPAPAPSATQNAYLAREAITAESSAGAPDDARLRDSESGSSGSNLSIALKKWTPDAPYIRRMQNTKTADLYRVYLDERPSYLESTAFFIDVADLMLERGLTALGLRVLSNLSELELENRAVLRILGYRYLQAKRPDLAIGVLESVVKLAPYEPQSYRDLGLAYAQNKQDQKAIETLYEVVNKEWDSRFVEVELIALNELNAILGRSSKALNTNFMDPKLIQKLPLDVRVALTWDADNTDIDLWITDPNGEKVFYSRPLSYQGGRISRDMTGGYGPEEFSLKRAKPGKYRIEVDYYGNTQQILAGAVTVQAKLITRFGSRAEKEELLTLRLQDKKENVLVGEFTVK